MRGRKWLVTSLVWCSVILIGAFSIVGVTWWWELKAEQLEERAEGEKNIPPALAQHM